MLTMDLGQRLLAFDEATHEFMADREEWPGALVFTCREADPFNLALIRGEAAPDADALLERIVTHYRSLGLTPRVRLTPDSRPEDWPERLARRGFVEQAEAAETFMLLPPEAPAPAAPGSAAAVRRVPRGEDVEVCINLAAEAFGMPGEMRSLVLDRARRRQPDDTFDYLATLDGQPAGVATARMAGGITGIYGVATLDRFRRRGIATALMRRLIEDARTAGHGTLYLSAHSGSYAEGLYARMGFVPLFSVQTYELPPER